MRQELVNNLVVTFGPHIKDMTVQDLKMRIEMALAPYDISKSEHALTVYEGDINELIMRRWLSAKIAQGCSARTIEYYRSTVTKALERIGKPYMDVTADDIRLFLAIRIHQDKVTKTTANDERRNLSAFYSWLQKEEILLKNPMHKVDNIKTSKIKRRAFTTMDIEQIRYACQTTREVAIVETLLSTWCRVSELSGMKKSDIKGDTVTVHGKGDKYRVCYLNARAILALKKYLEDRSDTNPYVFPRAKYTADVTKYAKGKKRRAEAEWYKNPELVAESGHIDISSVEALIRKIGRRAGVENCHPHRFRRTGATMALRGGMELIQVSKILGHEQISTTQIYLDISDEELAQAHKKYAI